MAAAASLLGGGNDPNNIFASVFPQKYFTTPTPETTPQIGSLKSPTKSFRKSESAFTSADATVRLERAWSVATRYLSVPDFGQQRHAARPRLEVKEAISLICGESTTRRELVAWCTNEMGGHLRQSVLPRLSFWQRPVASSQATEAIDETISVLEPMLDVLLSRPLALLDGTDRPSKQSVQQLNDQLRQAVLNMTLHSLPQHRIQKTLACALYQNMCESLARNDVENCARHGRCLCDVSLDLDLSSLSRVGLGGDLGERAFAHAMHKFLQRPAMERVCFRLSWTGKCSTVPKVREWVEQWLMPFMERSLGALNGKENLKMSDVDRSQFEQIAISNLGRLRTANLLDYVKAWPESMGALLDIRDCLASSLSEKPFVCSSFISQTSTRLLHAGASTTDILSIYTSVIHAFRLLDSRGVMLEKVAGPIRAYLRTRDDTVSIIAASFLAEVDEQGQVVAPDSNKVCPDITFEVSQSSLEDTRDHRVTDWNDMDWMPDPIDAGPNYKATMSEDVVAYILGLFDQEEFIKEVTTVLAQHLLQATDPEYVKETRLIELFKSRLDATKLQAAEVMLKDVRDSVRLNRQLNPTAPSSAVSAEPRPKDIAAAIPEGGITMQELYKSFETRMKPSQFAAALNLVATRRGERYYPKRSKSPREDQQPDIAASSASDYNVQVLSGFFWPQMRSNDFLLPSTMAEMDEAFGDRFARLGNQKKLHFRKALARVTVDLELEDRQIREENVPAWRASVINIFGEQEAGAALSSDQIMGVLEMEEELVFDALGYWTGKKVLYQPSPGTYAVLESLDMDSGPIQPAMQPQGEAVSAMMSQDAMLRESAPMFETFIKGMLRDGGPKEVGGFMGITNMLKMVLPTFTYGEDEVMLLLGEMEGRGEVARDGEMWAIAG
ncbi:hypothetical protein KC360_g7816 [Hortaea werneckii]|nr:hypothetical protein KC325_g3890 [Hortaea werneckii]KAI6994275.1 hypothetical protein KC359_g4698 [Hortaea werneckii]KAI7141654.1 hypothetical protein KC344_g7841 [Hortaea werneckii]KAI7168825.1 hypothetical protein KC360_g7816 [Hortaea werneckii]